jgi:AP-1-like factor
LKDLETKVEDLEKASESANHENSILRAQIEKMTAELAEYRKRFSLNGGVNRSSSLNSHALPSYLAGKGLGGISNPNDVSFQFEFPKFGRLPGPPQSNNNNTNSTSAMSSPSDLSSPGLGLQQYPSPRNQSVNSISGQPLSQAPALVNGTDMSSLSGLFSPSLLDTVSKSPNYDFFGTSGARTNGSRSSTDSNGNNTSYSSPSASSNGQQGSSSSCGTSPEPSTHSPHISKPVDSSLTTIGEEKTDEGELTFCDKLNMACGNSTHPVPRTMSKSNPGNLFNQNFDFNGIDWLAEQNNNQFDPQLFGDYREPQDNILAGDVFNNDSFFTDAFALPDFQTPASLEPSPAPAKKDLLAQIDQKQNEDEVVPAEDRSKLLNCNTIW